MTSAARKASCLLVVLLAWSAIQGGAQESAASREPGNRRPIQLYPTETQFLRIENAAYGAQWMLQLPEVVTAREGTILTWPGIPISWRREADGSLGYKWAPPPGYAGMVRAGGDKTSYDWVREMSLEVRAVPGKNRVQLKLALTNTGNQPLHDVWSDGACLQHMTPEFIDADHSRTFLRTGEGVVALTTAGRSLRIRTRYVFDSSFFEEPFVKKFEWFWGRSPARPVSGFVASRSTDGRRAVGIGWQDAFSIQQNSDRHHCMHSSPYFGTILPGKTAIRYGVILFGETVEALFAEFDRLGWRGHTARFQP